MLIHKGFSYTRGARTASELQPLARKETALGSAAVAAAGGLSCAFNKTRKQALPQERPLRAAFSLCRGAASCSQPQAAPLAWSSVSFCLGLAPAASALVKMLLAFHSTFLCVFLVSTMRASSSIELVPIFLFSRCSGYKSCLSVE